MPGSLVQATTSTATGPGQWCVGSCTPLMMAIIGRQLEMAERLLLLGADAGLKDDNDFTAAHWACVFDLKPVLILLRRNGASLSCWTLTLATIEFQAADCLAFLLIQHGVDACMPGGTTPLMIAACLHRPNMVRMVLQAGTRSLSPEKLFSSFLYIVDAAGTPPLYLACHPTMLLRSAWLATKALESNLTMQTNAFLDTLGCQASG